VFISDDAPPIKIKPGSAFARIQTRKHASRFLNSVQIVKEVFAGFVRQRIIDMFINK
jgi:hypothetical protein